MKGLLFFILLWLVCSSALAQKYPLDTSSLFNWKQAEMPLLCPNGNYFGYTIKNEPSGSETVVIKSIRGNWNIKFNGGRMLQFSPNSQYGGILLGRDSLGIILLGENKVEYFTGIESFDFFTFNNQPSIIFSKEGQRINVLALNDKYMREFDGVEYSIHKKSAAVLVMKERLIGDKKEELVTYLNLQNGKSKIIWQGRKAANFIWNQDGTQIAFSTEELAASEQTRFFWHYRLGDSLAVRLPSLGVDSIVRNMMLSSISRFSKDGNSLFINLRRKAISKPASTAAKVDVWTYQDAVLQSQQIEDLRFYGTKYFDAVISISKQKLFAIQEENYSLVSGRESDQWGVYAERTGERNERYWNIKAKCRYFLVSKQNGSRIELKSIPETNVIVLSPMERYIVYYHPNQRRYFSYEIATGKVKDISLGAIADWTVDNDRPESSKLAVGVAGWAAGDSLVFLYDRSDVWKFSTEGKFTPVNATNGFGKKHKVILRILQTSANTILPATDKILVSAFNSLTKDNGFYRFGLNESNDPEQLSMGSFFYYAPAARTFNIDDSHNLIPLKADSLNKYVVRRMRAEESPNFFYTEDFKTFVELSDVYPEKNYNWIKSELVNFKSLSGQRCQGILYKPENFDSTKKYPVIFYYYEKVSDGLHVFYQPQLAEGALNIPWLVSSGYLLFTPDINYTIGQPGRSAYNSVVAAANLLSKRNYVDRNNMGLQGHSFGGFETNYIITRSNLFKCALSSAGATDAIGGYLGIAGWGSSNLAKYEHNQHRLGTTLWDNQALFLENSPVLFANKITTPLLIMHNIKDANVSFTQGVELFIALRRLGKKVWLLQYDDGDHGLDSGDKISTLDFTIRMTQFFDYYLKGAAAPNWMTRGVEAIRKGVDNGLELDSSGILSEKGLLRQK